MQTYAVTRIDEIDALPDGRYRYRPVRHHLGIQSFGVTAWVGAVAGDPIINEYDEDSEPAEELFIVLSGRAIFDLEGEEVDATRGTLVFSAPGASELITGLGGSAFSATLYAGRYDVQFTPSGWPALAGDRQAGRPG